MPQKMVLGKAAYDIACEAGCVDAVEKARSEPDLFLMDLVIMPPRDGVRAVKVIREDASVRDVPILTIAAKSSRGPEPHARARALIGE
jgi:CheY-like chemotaxis protein